MLDIELGEVQAAFADIIWAHEPVGSGELVKICEKELGWKKPTTYTVLRKLCEKGIFKNEDSTRSKVNGLLRTHLTGRCRHSLPPSCPEGKSARRKRRRSGR